MAVPKLPKDIILMMASRNMRMHHYLWHTVRNNWENLSDSAHVAIKNLGWEPPRPALDKNGNTIYNNLSGEDFLYMHRQMIKLVNEKLKEIGQSDYLRIEGWKSIPHPGDYDFPVPPSWNSNLDNIKSDNYYISALVPQERQFKDFGELKSMSLGEMGARIEFTIHNTLHMRWASNPGEQRPTVEPWNPEMIDVKWDNPQYDYLGDTYSSHVNPLFWKLHGWVDDRIEDWKTANEVQEIQWTGTWEGPTNHHIHEEESSLIINKIESILQENELLPEFPIVMPTH